MKKGEIWKDPSDGELVEILGCNPWSYTILNGPRKGKVFENQNCEPDYAIEFVSTIEYYKVNKILSRYNV